MIKIISYLAGRAKPLLADTEGMNCASAQARGALPPPQGLMLVRLDIPAVVYLTHFHKS